MSLATLNGYTVSACRVSLPAFGCWWAEVETSHPDVLTGAVTLVLDDLTLKGTIVSGGAYQARTRYRIVGGAGGWGRKVAARGYRNDAGVRLGLVLADLARDAGEQLGTVPTESIGVAFARSGAVPAAHVLHELRPRGWYVDEAGVTQVGRRASTTYQGGATRIRVDLAHGRIELAAPALAALLPGAVVDGLEAVDVDHVLEGGKVRTTIWGRGIADSSRVSEALRRIVEAHTARSRFFAPWEYRVVDRSGNRLDLQATRTVDGMPDLVAVPVRPGVAGMRTSTKLGSLVVVQFLNGDPARPVVASFDDPDGDGFIPDEIFAQAGSTGASPTEHATSAEALVLLVATVLDSVLGPGSGAAAVLAAIPTTAAATLSAPLKAALDLALAAKTADSGGDKPGLGWPHVRGG